MQYRRLAADLANSLESALIPLEWPSYRTLKSHALKNKFKFSEREYFRLKRIHVGPSGLVQALINYYAAIEAVSIVNAVPQLRDLTQDRWLEHLSESMDGEHMRRYDYYRGVTWRELPLLLLLGDGKDADRSFCRDEATVRCIANAQYVEIAKSLASPSDWRKFGVDAPAVRERLGETLEEFQSLVGRVWTSVPESVWLTHSKNTLVGGSVIAPMTKSAYEQMRSGELNYLNLDAKRDLQFPSRDLFIIAMTELPGRPKSRLPGVKTALQTRKFLQHCAILLGDAPPSNRPVRFLVAVGAKKDEKAIERLGFQSLHKNSPGSDCPLYEMIVPAPEFTYARYTSAETTIATLIGTIWRMLRRAEQQLSLKKLSGCAEMKKNLSAF